MKRGGISLGRIFGIPIQLDYSWFLIFALVIWTLASGLFPLEFRGWPTYEYWVVGLITAVLFFTSVLLHELGHSVVAKHFKIGVSGINLFVFGGVSQIESEPPNARVEFVVAVVGPLVSFALAGIFYGLQFIFPTFAPWLALTRYLAYINALLGVFNLIPGFPLDGGRVFRSVVWGITQNLHRATLIAGTLGRVIGFLFIAGGVVEFFLGSFINGLWLGFIGWFLESTARSEIRQQQVEDLLTGHRVAEVMSNDYAAIPPEMTIQQLVDDQILAGGRRSFIVEEGEQIDGLLTLNDIKELPRAKWPTTTAMQAMIPLTNLRRIQPDEELWKAVEEMNEDGVSQLPVMTDGHLMGMLRREDVLGYLRNLRDLSKN